jgi:hypothetical protein
LLQAAEAKAERLARQLANAKGDRANAAAELEIHKDLGFKSWPDYIADVARREMPNIARSVEQRRQVVALLAGEGMSQRAIAEAVGVSQKTVDRDLDQVSHDDSPCPATDFADSAPVTTPDTVTGRDGKQYPAKPKPKPDAPKPAEPELTDDQIAELHRIADAIHEGRPWQEGLDAHNKVVAKPDVPKPAAEPRPLGEIKTWLDGRWHEYQSWDEVYDALHSGCVAVSGGITEAGRRREIRISTTAAKKLHIALLVLLDNKDKR